MTEPDEPTDREDTPTDAPDPPHPGPGDDDVEPAFAIDLEPDEQGTAEAGAEPSG